MNSLHNPQLPKPPRVATIYVPPSDQNELLLALEASREDGRRMDDLQNASIFAIADAAGAGAVRKGSRHYSYLSHELHLTVAITVIDAAHLLAVAETLHQYFLRRGWHVERHERPALILVMESHSGGAPVFIDFAKAWAVDLREHYHTHGEEWAKHTLADGASLRTARATYYLQKGNGTDEQASASAEG
jgi:hypothetical protein